MQHTCWVQGIDWRVLQGHNGYAIVLNLERSLLVHDRQLFWDEAEGAPSFAKTPSLSESAASLTRQAHAHTWPQTSSSDLDQNADGNSAYPLLDATLILKGRGVGEVGAVRGLYFFGPPPSRRCPRCLQRSRRNFPKHRPGPAALVPAGMHAADVIEMRNIP